MNRKPTLEQQRAIDSDAPDILVEAGAGSGKTSTTVDRYERLVREHGPESVLVFTFTEKAATELRERVREMRERAREKPKEATLEFSMSKVWIGTFHSICSRILRAHPIVADVDPSFDVLDDVRADRLKLRSFDLALRDTLKEITNADLLLARFNRDILRRGIRIAYERLRAAGQPSPALPDAPDPRSIGKLLTELAELVPEKDAKGIHHQTAPKIDALRTFLEERKNHFGEVTFEEFDEVHFTSTAASVRTLADTVGDVRGEIAAQEFGNETWEVMKELLARYGDEYSKAKERQRALDFEDLQLKTLQMLRDSEAIRDRYREQFTEIMVDEFQDTNQLQMDLIEALRGEETSLFTVGDEMQAIYGFRFADIDLFRNRRKSVDRPVTPLRLSANFRSQSPVIGAVNLIGRAFDELVAGSRKPQSEDEEPGATGHEFAELRVGAPDAPGYRSQVEILLTQANESPKRPTPKNPDPPPPRPGWREADLGTLSPPPRTDPETGELLPGPVAEGEHAAEALALAHHIRKAIHEEGVSAGEIVILFRAKSQIWLFEEALRLVGIQSYVVGGSRFWETREGTDLRALIGTIANPRDDESLIGCLAGPACGLSTPALFTIARGRGKEDPIWPKLEEFARTGQGDFSQIDRDRATGFVRTIDSLRNRAAGMPLAELINEAVIRTGYDLVNLTADPSGSGLANIRRVADIAAEFEKTEGRDLRGLIDWIDASAALDAEAAVATEDEGADVVRLMTIHKSKGLEFGMVCLADLGKGASGSTADIIWVSPRAGTTDIDRGLRLPLPDGGQVDLFDWTKLQAEAKSDDEDEELRVFHVGMTRAERRLVLSGISGMNPKTRSTSVTGRLTRHFKITPEGPEQVEAPAPDGLETLDVQPGPSEITIIRNLPANAKNLRKTSPVELEPVAGDQAEPPLNRPQGTVHPEVPLSYSALAEFQDCPARFFARRILKLRDPETGLRNEDPETEPDQPLDPELTPQPRPDASRFGNAVHLLLELMAGRKWIAPSEKEIARVLEREGVKPDQAATALAGEMISGFTGSNLGGEVKGRSVATEARLLIDFGGVMVRGFADLLVRDMSPPLILDYKSNQLEGTSIDEVMKKYELQRDLYALAVRQALGVESVETAFVFLRDPDHPVRDTFDETRLAEAEVRISRLVGDIVAGRYLGGPDAVNQPCGNCRACDLLAGQIKAAAAKAA